MAKTTREVRIFYSWQSDSPEECNKNAIRNALRVAAKRVEKAQPDLKVTIDEATKRTAGSPNIAAKILEKIAAADMMVADSLFSLYDDTLHASVDEFFKAWTIAVSYDQYYDLSRDPSHSKPAFHRVGWKTSRRFLRARAIVRSRHGGRHSRS